MTERDRLPEIEPLSDISWRRVEEGVFARLDAEAAKPARGARRLDRRWLVAGVVVAAAAGLLLFVVTRGAGPAPDSARTSHIAAGDAATRVTFGDVSLTVQPQSAVLVTEGDRGTDIVLERGTVRCAVAEQEAGHAVRVLAGEVTVRVVGTVFAVTRTGDTAEVEVERGEVEVVSRGERVTVGAGERWPAAETAAAEPAPAPEPVEMAPDTITRRPERARPKATPRASARERFAAAAALEATDASGAIAAYAQLARERGPWAAPALFARGRLETELGRTAAARRTLERYLSRYPRGANATDARALLDDMK